MNYIVVDNTTLQNLYSIGGSSAWDVLLASADRIVITDQILEEARLGPHGANLGVWIDQSSDFC